MKTKEELWKEVQGRGWETIVDVIQRDAWDAGVTAGREDVLSSSRIEISTTDIGTEPIPFPPERAEP